MSSVFESVMLVCFGLSWPLNVVKAYRARTAKGMSLPFILLIISGYIAGIAAKLTNPAYMAAFGEKWYVLFFYVLNFTMVAADVVLYFRNKRLDKMARK